MLIVSGRLLRSENLLLQNTATLRYAVRKLNVTIHNAPEFTEMDLRFLLHVLSLRKNAGQEVVSGI
jgi:hypothetical protein